MIHARGTGVRLPTTALQFDIFGLGPTEVILMAAAAGVLYGPDRLKAKAQENGAASGKPVSKGWRLDRIERIEDMQKYAQTSRRRRALDRVNEALEEEDPYVVERMAEYEDKG
jgi:hypothetical protein